MNLFACSCIVVVLSFIFMCRELTQKFFALAFFDLITLAVFGCLALSIKGILTIALPMDILIGAVAAFQTLVSIGYLVGLYDRDGRTHFSFLYVVFVLLHAASIIFATILYFRG